MPVSPRQSRLFGKLLLFIHLPGGLMPRRPPFHRVLLSKPPAAATGHTYEWRAARGSLADYGLGQRSKWNIVGRRLALDCPIGRRLDLNRRWPCRHRFWRLRGSGLRRNTPARRCRIASRVAADGP